MTIRIIAIILSNVFAVVFPKPPMNTAKSEYPCTVTFVTDQLLVIGSNRGALCKFDIEKSKAVECYTFCNEPISSLNFDSTRNHLFFIRGDSDFCCLSMTAKKLIRSTRIEHEVFSCFVSPRANLAFACCHDNVICVFSSSDASRICELNPKMKSSGAQAVSASYFEDSELLVVAHANVMDYRDGLITVWDMKKRELRESIQVEAAVSVHSVGILDAQKGIILFGGSNKKIVEYSLFTNREIASSYATKEPISSVGISCDAKKIAYWETDGRLTIASVKDRAQSSAYRLSPGRVYRVHFSANGKYMAFVHVAETSKVVVCNLEKETITSFSWAELK